MSRPGVDLRPVAPGDITALAENLRDQDRVELLALGHDPTQFGHLIADSVEASEPDLCHSIWSPTGEFMGICGLAVVERSLLGVSSAAPWMLGTPAVPRNGRALNRTTRRYNALMRARSPLLFNHVHAKNSVSVAWLQRVGFVLEPAVPFGPYGEPFHYFSMRNV